MFAPEIGSPDSFSPFPACLALARGLHLCMRFTSLVLLLSITLAFSSDWPAWRGPDGSGITTETKLPTKWSKTENVKWRVPLPAPGNSTPIVVGERIFLTQAAGDRREVQ